MQNWPYFIGALLLTYYGYKIFIRLRLSRAKHPSLRGHSKMSRRVARLIPIYEYPENYLFRCDDAPSDVETTRKEAFHRLARGFKEKAPNSIELTKQIENGVSDIQFTNHYRVPFQFRTYVKNHLATGSFAEAVKGNQIRDLDGNWSIEVFGSYGVNVFGNDFYKRCLDRGIERVRDLGPVLGPYHPVMANNVRSLLGISGLEEVSFHMSGTEAVMQAVRLARYHTGKKHLVRFCGSYHGWWDGVQPGIGSQRVTNDVYTLKDMDEITLKVLRTRQDIACVIVNPLQAIHPNANAPGDAMLIASDRSAGFDRAAYTKWLKQLREVCKQRGIVLILDEVFLGFRLAKGGAQEYFDIKADLVTYGKSLGGGLPVGVVCGRADLMKRFKPERPTDVCFARGTFNSHPYVMGTMHAFLEELERLNPDYEALDAKWNQRVEELNSRLKKEELPVKVVNLSSVWTILYTQPSRFNWMFQYYLRSKGLALSWVGTGRFILQHDLADTDYEEVVVRFIEAAIKMKADLWWWDCGLTNKEIKRRILLELIRARFVK